MENKAINIIKNISYTIFSNIVSLGVSVLVTLIVPKLFGVEEYGYWQLFAFYSSYVGIFHLGWNDGIYLRYGGENYDSLDKNSFHSQFVMLSLSQLVISVIIVLISTIFVNDMDRRFIFYMLSIDLILVNLQGFLNLLLQATNRIRAFSSVILVNRVIYFLILVLFLILGSRNFKFMVLADLLGKGFGLALAIYYCRDIVIRHIVGIYFNFREVYLNIIAGSKLMIANFSSMLIIGTVRFGIERNWSVSTFGKVSLTLSISNMMLVFINAISVVIFPILKNINEKQYTRIYYTLRDILMTLSFGLLLIYYPAKVLLSDWLPNYSEALNYMGILFPIFIYEGKISLLLNTFFKVLRKESELLKVNLITVTASAIISILTTIILKDLDLAIFSIVILLALKAFLAERILARTLQISLLKDFILESMLTLIFIFSGWVINSWLTPLIYLVFYMVYLIVKKDNNKNAFNFLRDRIGR